MDGIWYNCIVLSGMQIPEYRCAGPVQRSAVNHVRRGKETTEIFCEAKNLSPEYMQMLASFMSMVASCGAVAQKLSDTQEELKNVKRQCENQEGGSK